MPVTTAPSYNHSLPSLRNGSLYRCADGSIMEPLDMLHLFFFPNHGRDARGDNVCFVQKHMKISSLNAFLPQQTELFLTDDFVDSTIALIIVSVFITIALILGKYLWEAVDSSFRNITPSHKKWYVVANMSKAFFLGCLVLSPKYWVGFYKQHFLDEFQLLELKRTMAIYIGTDLVALYLVPKLPTSTILHHVVTVGVSFIVFGLNLELKGRAGVLGLAKMLLLYGTFSTIPFLVNAYLALRVVYSKSIIVKYLCHLSLVTYLICCFFNWSIDLLWLLGYWGQRELSFHTLFYCLVVLFVIYDDTVLIKWLVKQNSPANNKTH